MLNCGSGQFVKHGIPAIVLLVWLFQSALGCTFYPVYLSKFDKSEYVLTAEVIGYVGPVKFNREINTSERLGFEYKAAYGLKVRLKETVYLPKSVQKYFEVFPLTIDSACTSVGLSQNDLKKDFPLNSEVFVVAKESRQFSQISEEGILRVESSYPISNIISLNRTQTGASLTNAASIFDFSQFKVNLNLSENSDDLKYVFMFDFEARKELLRLQNAKTFKEKEIIIKRLLENPTRVIDSFKILKSNLKDQKEILRIYEQRLRFENDIYQKILKTSRVPINSEDKIQELLQKARLDLQKNRRLRRSQN